MVFYMQTSKDTRPEQEHLSVLLCPCGCQSSGQLLQAANSSMCIWDSWLPLLPQLQCKQQISTSFIKLIRGYFYRAEVPGLHSQVWKTKWDIKPDTYTSISKTQCLLEADYLHVQTFHTQEVKNKIGIIEQFTSMTKPQEQNYRRGSTTCCLSEHIHHLCSSEGISLFSIMLKNIFLLFWVTISDTDIHFQGKGCIHFFKYLTSEIFCVTMYKNGISISEYRASENHLAENWPWYH